ncbi:unnamed protein product [Blepharisma stoltei]|uniref:Uncharacterized protein n=1 Tax=Blepharisma stoltei TaxID=1481888 RepID=A0AAU9JQ58_9CILI|nr:unnamed protein product [Blepharisma stoltei]
MQASYVYGPTKNFIISFDEENPPDLSRTNIDISLSRTPSCHSYLPPISSNKLQLKKKCIPKRSKKKFKKNSKIQNITMKLHDQEVEKRHQRSNSYNGMTLEDENIKGEIIRLRQNKSKTKYQNLNVSSIYNISMSMINTRNFGLLENLHRKQASLPSLTVSTIETPISHSEELSYFNVSKDGKLDGQTHELYKLRNAMASLINKEEADLDKLNEPKQTRKNLLMDLKPIFQRLLSIVMKAKKKDEFDETEKRRLVEQYKAHLRDSDDKMKVIIGTLSILEQDLKDSKIQFHELKIEMLIKKIERYKEALKLFQITRDKLKDAIKLFEADSKKEAQQKTVNVFNIIDEQDDIGTNINSLEKKKTEAKKEENKFRKGRISLADFMKM